MRSIRSFIGLSRVLVGYSHSVLEVNFTTTCVDMLALYAKADVIYRIR